MAGSKELARNVLSLIALFPTPGRDPLLSIHKESHCEPFAICHSEPFAYCHSEQSEESQPAQDKLREETEVATALPRNDIAQDRLREESKGGSG